MLIEYKDGNFLVNSILYTKVAERQCRYSIHSQSAYISFCMERKVYNVRYNHIGNFIINLCKTPSSLHNSMWWLYTLRSIKIEVNCGVLTKHTIVEETAFDNMGHLVGDTFPCQYQSCVPLTKGI